ncbi:GGDEF domain-containing protein, partial [Pseudoxanthomonas beigongshangi]
MSAYPVAPPSIARLGALDPDLQAMVESAVQGGTPLMLLHVDIDHFRSINENMGADVGDQALLLLGQHLSTQLGPEARVWRQGSDEFIVAMPRLPQVPSPDAFGAFVRDQVELPMAVLPYTLFLTATVGMALCP